MRVAFIIGFFFIASMALGHARFTTNSDVTPRNNNPALKVGPCGEVPRTANPTQLVAGQQITLRWEETIDHPGSYFIEFSPASDDNWVRVATIVDLQNGDATIPHFYSYVMTVPNIVCQDCTIRLVQEMTDRNPPTYYYSCGDIQISAAPVNPGVPPVNPPGNPPANPPEDNPPAENPKPVPSEYDQNPDGPSCSVH